MSRQLSDRSGLAALCTLVAVVPLVTVLALVDGDNFALPVGLAVAWAIALGSLGAAASGRAGRLEWTVPALLRIAEYALVLRLADLRDCPASGFAVLAAIVYHHYDLVYRAQKAGQAEQRKVWGLLGWAGGMVLVFTLAAADVARIGFLIAAAVCGVIALAATVAGWRQLAAGEAA